MKSLCFALLLSAFIALFSGCDSSIPPPPETEPKPTEDFLPSPADNPPPPEKPEQPSTTPLQVTDSQLAAVSLARSYPNGSGPIIALPNETIGSIIYPIFSQMQPTHEKITPTADIFPYRITLADGSTYLLQAGTTSTQTPVSYLIFQDMDVPYLIPNNSFSSVDTFYNDTMTSMQLAAAPQDPNDPTMEEEYLQEKYSAYLAEKELEAQANTDNFEDSDSVIVDEYEVWKSKEADKQPERRQMEMDIYYSEKLRNTLLKHLPEELYSSIRVEKDDRAITIVGMEEESVLETALPYNIDNVEIRFRQGVCSLALQKVILHDLEKEKFAYYLTYHMEPNGMVTISCQGKYPSRLRSWLRDYQYRTYIQLEQLPESMEKSLVP